MVTDLDGHITQNVVYIPYGEVFVEERNGSWASPYLFNAKELDEETGLYYYGARYLDPAGARWLSVDPMWEDHGGSSPYNYCMSNPVKLIDPDGRDEWNFSQNGELVKHRTNKEKDIFNIVDENGNILKDKTKSFEYNTFKQESITITKKGKTQKKYTYFSTGKNDKSKQLFEFLADNTNVEWTNLTFKTESTVSTSGDINHEYAASYILKSDRYKDKTLIGHTHSHPGGNYSPSGFEYDNPKSEFFHKPADMQHIKKLCDINAKKGISDPKFQIYVPKTKTYVKYNKNSKHYDFFKYYQKKN